VDKFGSVVANPFPKFFNLNEVAETREENLPLEIPLVTEKLDGVLGVLYFDNDQPCITSRGCFTSPYAVWATKWIRRFKRSDFREGYTYLFEVICNISKIVVDYKGYEV